MTSFCLIVENGMRNKRPKENRYRFTDTRNENRFSKNEI